MSDAKQLPGKRHHLNIPSNVCVSTVTVPSWRSRVMRLRTDYWTSDPSDRAETVASGWVMSCPFPFFCGCWK
jgi:hypothetical protein